MKYGFDSQDTGLRITRSMRFAPSVLTQIANATSHTPIPLCVIKKRRQ